MNCFLRTYTLHLLRDVQWLLWQCDYHGVCMHWQHPPQMMTMNEWIWEKWQKMRKQIVYFERKIVWFSSTTCKNNLVRTTTKTLGYCVTTLIENFFRIETISTTLLLLTKILGKSEMSSFIVHVRGRTVAPVCEQIGLHGQAHFWL
jgi:hypothetical protein